MLKSLILFLLVISINFLESKERYRVVPSPSLAQHASLIYKTFRESEQYIVEKDFYLTNITRIMYYLIIVLQEKGIYIEMKGLWREQTKSDYTNHLYVYFAWENPRHDPC
jgi:hypothetical protein